MKYLSESFYARDTAVVARELLGKVLVRRINGDIARCRIVETEAYFSQNDPASHAARGRTKRNSVMFGPPGRAYVYFNYGVHHLFNVVTELEGTAGAVLIRAVEPVVGAALLLANRQVAIIEQLTSGPAKLTQALGIDLSHNEKQLNTEELGIIESDDNGFNIVAARRIGISAGGELDLRFYIEKNPYVSRRCE
ncbi:MAG: DNA-3-methyladenine glycosylase [Actinomycetota bacterium]|nr:DNA-3-methyladenine glycosylase [Actinomycetota bacterium]